MSYTKDSMDSLLNSFVFGEREENPTVLNKYVDEKVSNKIPNKLFIAEAGEKTINKSNFHWKCFF